jgi:hypothetical protein
MRSSLATRTGFVWSAFALLAALPHDLACALDFAEERQMVRATKFVAGITNASTITS